MHHGRVGTRPQRPPEPTSVTWLSPEGAGSSGHVPRPEGSCRRSGEEGGRSWPRPLPCIYLWTSKQQQEAALRWSSIRFLTSVWTPPQQPRQMLASSLALLRDTTDWWRGPECFTPPSTAQQRQRHRPHRFGPELPACPRPELQPRRL